MHSVFTSLVAPHNVPRWQRKGSRRWQGREQHQRSLSEFQAEIKTAATLNTQVFQKVTAPTTLDQDVAELTALLEDSLKQTSTNSDTNLSSPTPAQDTSVFDTTNEIFDQATMTLDQETESYNNIYDSLNKKLDTHTCTLNDNSTYDPTPHAVPDLGGPSSCAARGSPSSHRKEIYQEFQNTNRRPSTRKR